MSTLKTKQIMKTALDDLVEQGISPDNIVEFVSTVSGTLGFVYGALHVASEKRVSLEEIDLQIDSLADFVKTCARRTAELTPTKAN
jgi:hypothetical protein